MRQTGIFRCVPREGRPLVSGISGGEFTTKWRTRTGANPLNEEGYADGLTGNGVRPLFVLAWLFPQQMTDRLLEEVERSVNEEFPVADRPARIEELEATIAAAEYVEEALVEQAMKSGYAVTRRSDSSIRAILGVEVKVRTKAKVAA